MPTIHVKLAPLQNPEQYEAISQRLTAITADILHKDPTVTAVIIDDLPAGRWSIGGHAVTQPTAWVEISITAQTNTDTEKARWIAAAFEAMQSVLGRLALASYCVVRELPAADWGYGGLTQSDRKRQKSAPAAGLAHLATAPPPHRAAAALA
jgi:4-oxalocrotonate tautomerase